MGNIINILSNLSVGHLDNKFTSTMNDYSSSPFECSFEIYILK